MKILISITLVVLAVSAQRVKRGEFSYGSELEHVEFSHGDLGGHESHHPVATSYQNVHLESHNPVPVIIHKVEEHHGHHGHHGHHELGGHQELHLEGHGGSFEGLGHHGFNLEEHAGFEGHGLEGLELHGFEGHGY